MIVKTVDVRKTLGKTLVLKGISLEIKKGEIFGFVGPDGAGKTTFIRTILDLYRPDSGEVLLFDGKDSIENSKNKIGYVSQQFSLNTDMTVWENICLFAQLHQLKEDVLLERAEKLLNMVWLGNFKERLAGDLSGGMKQKLALVCSVIHNPELLILDEPTTGVDPVSRREFWQMLYRLNKDGLTILVSTPYMDEVELCGRIAFFHLGKICALGSPNELLAQYPYKLFAVQSENLRLILDKMFKLPARSVYLQGELLHVALDDEKRDMPLLKEALEKSGLDEFSVFELQPTLEDLFSFLSAKEEDLL